MYFIKTPRYLKSVYPSLLWDIPKPATVFLTFDDGPVPGVTDAVLDILKEYGVVATFFCIGDNVVKHPALFQRILNEGHTVGNHTFHHLNGWKTDNDTYLEDVSACGEVVNSVLFRPPYGRIGFNQIQTLKHKFTIVMWDVLSGDFDVEIDSAKCVENVVSNVTPGSIIVFHDSEKAGPRVLPSLPIVIEQLLASGYQFATVPAKTIAAPQHQL